MENNRTELFGCAAEPRSSYSRPAGDHSAVVGDGAGEIYRLLVSEAVEAECERGNPEMVKLRQELLKEVSLFPVDQRILGVARLLIVSEAIPAKAGPDAGAYCGSGC